VSRTKIVIWSLVSVGVAAVITGVILHNHHWRPRVITIQGAVIRRDDDTRKELPVADASVTATDGVSTATAQSDANGYFKLRFQGGVWPDQTLLLKFSHPDYEPLDMTLRTGFRIGDKELHIAALKPIPRPETENTNQKLSVVSNIRIRYTENSQNEVNVGSAVRTFQVVNKANVPCDHKLPCSPDGSWKATSSSISLDAGAGNVFRDIRASCIAGPCPFAQIETSDLENDGRTLKVTALDWSDPVTFLVEAEVFHSAIASKVRLSYPVQFGRTLNFTLPPTQEGVSIVAEVDGASMVFPLGPNLYLSWATCTMTSSGEQKTTVYRCELKPGYRF
jgi:hypothetical protein